MQAKTADPRLSTVADAPARHKLPHCRRLASWDEGTAGMPSHLPQPLGKRKLTNIRAPHPSGLEGLVSAQ